MQRKWTDKDRALLVITVLLIAGYAFRSEAMLGLTMIIASILLVSWLWRKFALRSLRYQRHFSESRAFVGETVALTLSVSNHKFLPLTRLRLVDQVSSELVFSDLTLETSPIVGMAQIRQFFALSWFETIARTYHLTCQQRGVYDFALARVQSGDPFGFFTQESDIGATDRLIVYPEVKPVTGLDLPYKEPLGSRTVNRPIFEDPIYLRGVRPYQAQDDIRHVHWKATARNRELQTKIFEPTSTPHLVLFVNVSTYAKAWEGIDPVLLERVVSVAASICAYAVQQRRLTGLSANGTLPRSDQPLRVVPSRSPQQLTHLLEALAAVRGIASGRFERLLFQESSRLPWGATLMVVTAVVTPELEVTLLRLKDAGRKLVLLSLDDAPPPHWLQGVVTYHLPGRDTDEIFNFIPVGVSQTENEVTA